MQISEYFMRRSGRQRALPGQYWWYKAEAVGAAGGRLTGQKDQFERTGISAKEGREDIEGVLHRHGASIRCRNHTNATH